MSKPIKYSEIFTSIQGEGPYTGVPFVWLRFFTCNLQCDGFGQKDPTDPSTYELPYKTFDVSSVKHIEDLPVFDKGCDSSYSWSAKYKHLQRQGTAKEIAAELISYAPNAMKDKGDLRIAFTGGEPMLNQQAMADIVEELVVQMPNLDSMMVLIETNGTQKEKDCLPQACNDAMDAGVYVDTVYSISPKLWAVSGEKPEKAINHEAIRSMLMNGSLSMAYLKFVLNTDSRAWQQAEELVAELSKDVYGFDTWVMPVGATEEQQQGDDVALIAEKAIQMDWNVSARVHTYIWGNKIGT